MEFEHGRSPGRRINPNDIPWDLILTLTPLVILGLMLLYAGLNSVYTVAPDEKAVVMRLGKYQGPPVESGLHFCIPLVDKVLKVSIKEHSLRLPFGLGADRPQAASQNETLVLTADLNAALVEWTVQWKVSQPDQFLFRFYNANDDRYPERVITTVARTVMNRLVGDYSIDEVLTEKRGEIGVEAREATQKILDSYSCGVEITELQMQRVTPPDQVRPAFDQVNAAIQLRDQLVNEANKERNKLKPEALAQKDKVIKEAEGYAARRKAETAGKINALRAKYEAYQMAPEITRKRLYIEAMQKILSAVESQVIVDSDLKQRMIPLLQLDQGVKP